MIEPNNEDKSKRNTSELYRALSLLVGASAIFYGISLTSLLSTTILASIGCSSIISALLGGMNEKDLMEIKTDSIDIGIIKNLVANIKVSGPVVTFFAVGFLVFSAGFLIEDSESKQYTKIRKIVNDVDFKHIGSEENINGLIIDNNNVYSRISLVYKTELKEPYDKIVIPKSLIKHGVSPGIKLEEIFKKKDLSLNHRLNEVQGTDSENIEFGIKDGNNQKVSLGFLEQDEIIDVLTNLADITSNESGNNVTDKIFEDCAALKGLCKMPETIPVQISFSDSVPLDTAIVCPKSEVFTRFKLNNKTKIFLTESIMSFPEGVTILKASPYSGNSPCLKNIKNWIQVNSSYADGIFNNTSVSRLTQGYATFFY